MQIRNQHILRIGYVDKTGPLLVLVSTLGIPFPSQPESLPSTQTVAVNNTGAAHGKAVHMVGIDQRRKIKACLSLDTSFAYLIVRGIIASL